MKKITMTAAAFLLVLPAVFAQTMPRTYTTPAAPSRKVLDPLHLKLAWSVYVPTENRRDGLFSVQILPDQILIQTRSGMIAALDPNDGSTQWRAQVGLPYRVGHLLAYNAKSVIAVRGAQVYSLDRKDGRQQWLFTVPYLVTASPAADEERMYLCLSSEGRLFSYLLPAISRKEETPPPAAASEKKREVPATPYSGLGVSGQATEAVSPLGSEQHGVTAGAQPRLLWEYRTEARLELTPLLHQDALVAADTDGTIYTLFKRDAGVQYRFHSPAALTATMTQHGGYAYVANHELNFQAFDIQAGKFAWRLTTGGVILRPPTVNDEDIFITPEQSGLYRIQRSTGDVLWTQPKAVRFLAENKTFVYAADRVGNLLILDRSRGTVMTSYNARDFVVPISNEITDRLFLGAHDGLLVCLHDRDYPKPLILKQPAEPPAEEKPPPKQPAEKTDQDKAAPMENKVNAAPGEEDKKK